MQGSNIKNRFGSAVRARRWELNLTQEGLAERADLNRTYITDIERGLRNVSLESIDKLAEALELPVASLFNEWKEAARAGRSTGKALEEQFVEILMVEDNLGDALLALEAFKRAKIANRVRVASDGAEALNLLLGVQAVAAISPWLPHVILLDLNLPKVDGREVLRRLKASPRTRHIPVIVLTGSEHERDFEECRRLGAAHYIVKPVDFHRFSRVTSELDLTWVLIKHMDSSPEGYSARLRKP